MKTHTSPNSFRHVGVTLMAICLLWAGDASATCSTTDVSCWINLVKKMSKDVNSLKDDVIPAVKTTLKNVENDVSEVENTLTELENGGTKIVGEFKGAIDAVEKDAGQPVGEFFTFSDELVSRLTDGWAYVTSELEKENADYVAFAGTDGQCTPVCDAFRKEIGGMIRRFGQVTEAGTAYLEKEIEASGGSLAFKRTFDTGSWANEVETAPAILLYPLHVAVDGMAGASLVPREPAGFRSLERPPGSVRVTCTGGSYCGVVNAVHDALDRIENSFSQLGQIGQGKRASATWPPPCSSYDLDSSLQDFGYILFVYGAIQTVIASPLESAGFAGLDTTVSPGADVAASAMAAIKARPLRELAHGLKMVGDPPLTGADILLSRIGDCRNRLNAQFLLCKTIQGDDCQARVLGGEVFGF